MRAKQFIVEYDRTKTAQAFAAKLVNTAMADNTVPGAVRKNIQDNMTPVEAAEMILKNQIEVGDPTKQKKYTQALARMYANGLIKWEDIGSTMRDYLTKFATLAVKKLLKPEHSDFNRFKDLKSFYDVVDQYEEPEGKEQRSKGDAKEVYKDANVRIIKPEDINAACYYGQGTRWCTAADSNNMFDRYNRDGPMYILLPTKAAHEGEKYQVHPQSGQYMDEQDRDVDAEDLIKRFGDDFREWWLTVDPDLGGRIIFFPNEDELRKACEEIKQLSLEFLNEIMMDWEMEDEGYYEYLRDEGYVDEEGEYKDDYPAYTDYNDSASAYYGNVYSALDITVDEVREIAKQIEEDDGRYQYIGDLENVFSISVENAIDRQDGLPVTIYRRIQVTLKDGKITVEYVPPRDEQGNTLEEHRAVMRRNPKTGVVQMWWRCETGVRKGRTVPSAADCSKAIDIGRRQKMKRTRAKTSVAQSLWSKLTKKRSKASKTVARLNKWRKPKKMKAKKASKVGYR
jgi:hypothetical protein